MAGGEVVQLIAKDCGQNAGKEKSMEEWKLGIPVWMFQKLHLGPADMLKQYLVGKSIISDREPRWILITYYCVLLSTWIQVCFIQSKLDTECSELLVTCKDSNAGSACEESLFWLPSLKKRSFLIHPWVSLDQQINNNNVSFSTQNDTPRIITKGNHTVRSNCRETEGSARTWRIMCRSCAKTSGSEGGRKRSL